jgi:hypothetical protein
MSTAEIPHGPEHLTQIVNPAEAAGSRIAQINSGILGTAVELAPTAIGIGLLIYGFRKVYQNTLGKIL